MRICIIYFILLISFTGIVAQKIEIGAKIDQNGLNKVRQKYIVEQRQRKIAMLTVEFKSILIDIIPKIVIKDREIRYKWDKYIEKSINVYKHLVHYDSINGCNYTYLKNSYFDTSFTLGNSIDSKNVLQMVDYTNTICIDTFKYNFNFVDDPKHADFVLSSFSSVNETQKLLYIWHYKNVTECTLYHVEATLPWDIDCYKIKIKEERLFID
jgi:hypothetical protein